MEQADTNAREDVSKENEELSKEEIIDQIKKFVLGNARPTSLKNAPAKNDAKKIDRRRVDDDKKYKGRCMYINDTMWKRLKEISIERGIYSRSSVVRAMIQQHPWFAKKAEEEAKKEEVE